MLGFLKDLARFFFNFKSLAKMDRILPRALFASYMGL